MRALIVAILVFSSSNPARADDFDLGLENFLYRSSASLLNRDNVLGLAPNKNLFRLTGSGRKALGSFSARVSAFVERQSGKDDESRVVVRQAFVDYKTDAGFLLRIGRQKTGWGSGFVWNPTSRLEPPKSPANPSTEQPGIDALRIDVSPSDRASFTLVAGRADAGLTDLPGSLARERDPVWTGGARGRFLARDTDIAVTFIAGAERPELWGLDIGRTWGAVALHAESSFYRGSEIDAARPDDRFVRVAVGGLWSPGDTSVSVEYFFNGEGMSAAGFRDYTARLDGNLTSSLDPRLPSATRAMFLAAWSADAAIPFSSNLGLRRHYASVALSRRDLAPDLTTNLRAVVGLDDRGLILTPGLAYAPRGNVQMSFDVVLLFGPEASEYRLAPIERAFQARLKYSF